jgi:hypothetical protein
MEDAWDLLTDSTGNRPSILVLGRDWRGWITTGERP